MNNKLDKLKDIKNENNIWFIYIGIIVLSWYTNSKEKDFILHDDETSRKEYQNIMIVIFSVLVIVYYYFAKDSLEDFNKLKETDTTKKKKLTYISLIGSILILISGILFLGIAITDDEIDTEIAFN